MVQLPFVKEYAKKVVQVPCNEFCTRYQISKCIN